MIKQKEEMVLDIQRRMKVGRAEARRIQKETYKSREIPACERYYKITFDNSARRKIYPFKKENSLKTEYSIKRDNITTNRNSFIIKSENVKQSNKINIKSINNCRSILQGKRT